MQHGRQTTDSPGTRLLCLPGRSVHPSNQLSDDVVRSRPTGALSFGALRAIAVGMARVHQPLPPGPAEADAIRSLRLLRTAFYDAWLVTWPVGSALGPHGHGGARSLLQVIDGELVEYRSGGIEEPASARALLRGDASLGIPSLVHGLANRSDAEATTLHVYSPPLEGFSFTDEPFDAGSEPGVPAVTELTSVLESERLPRPVPPPLALVQD